MLLVLAIDEVLKNAVNNPLHNNPCRIPSIPNAGKVRPTIHHNLFANFDRFWLRRVRVDHELACLSRSQGTTDQNPVPLVSHVLLLWGKHFEEDTVQFILVSLL